MVYTMGWNGVQKRCSRLIVLWDGMGLARDAVDGLGLGKDIVEIDYMSFVRKRCNG